MVIERSSTKFVFKFKRNINFSASVIKVLLNVYIYHIKTNGYSELIINTNNNQLWKDYDKLKQWWQRGLKIAMMLKKILNINNDKRWCQRWWLPAAMMTKMMIYLRLWWKRWWLPAAMMTGMMITCGYNDKDDDYLRLWWQRWWCRGPCQQCCWSPPRCHRHRTWFGYLLHLEKSSDLHFNFSVTVHLYVHVL